MAPPGSTPPYANAASSDGVSLTTTTTPPEEFDAILQSSATTTPENAKQGGASATGTVPSLSSPTSPHSRPQSRSGEPNFQGDLTPPYGLSFEGQDSLLAQLAPIADRYPGSGGGGGSSDGLAGYDGSGSGSGSGSERSDDGDGAQPIDLQGSAAPELVQGFVDAATAAAAAAADAAADAAATAAAARGAACGFKDAAPYGRNAAGAGILASAPTAPASPSSTPTAAASAGAKQDTACAPNTVLPAEADWHQQLHLSSPMGGAEAGAVSSSRGVHEWKPFPRKGTGTGNGNGNGNGNAYGKRKAVGPPGSARKPAADEIDTSPTFNSDGTFSDSAVSTSTTTTTTSKRRSVGASAGASDAEAKPPQAPTTPPQIKWKLYKEDSWFPLLARAETNGSPMLAFACDVNDGIKMAPTSGAFVNHRNNSFVLTVAVTRPSEEIFVLTPEGHPGSATELRFGVHAVHCEDENKTVAVIQGSAKSAKAKKDDVGSKKDKKEKLKTVTYALPPEDGTVDSKKAELGAVVKGGAPSLTSMHTISNLHFATTTAFNVRKGKMQNLNQRYFALVATLYAKVSGVLLPIAVHRSDPVIVRASSAPAKHEALLARGWMSGPTGTACMHRSDARSDQAQSPFEQGASREQQQQQKLHEDKPTCNFSGQVGINCRSPDQSLVVFGNIRLAGEMFRPSDRRVKMSIQPANTAQQLANIKNVRICHYNLTAEWAQHVGRAADDRACVGVIAQELRTILPEAVAETGDVELVDGSEIKGLLAVDYDRLHTEAIGAVKELASLADGLESRLGAARAATLEAATKLSAAHVVAADPSTYEYEAASSLGWGCALAVAVIVAVAGLR